MSIWDEVYFAVGQVIVKAGFAPYDEAATLSIANSASRLAKDAYETHKDYFRKLGKLTFERAVPFVAVFALAMTSRWVRQACILDQSLDRRNLWASLTSNVLRIFGDTNQDHYQEASLLDIQFNHDRTLIEQRKLGRKPIGKSGETVHVTLKDLFDHEGVLSSWNEQWLLLCLAARALGARFTWKLSSPPIPFASARDLYEHIPNFDPPVGLNLLDFEKALCLNDALSASEAGMYAAFKAIREKENKE
jgi:hypothetical protein